MKVLENNLSVWEDLILELNDKDKSFLNNLYYLSVNYCGGKNNLYVSYRQILFNESFNKTFQEMEKDGKEMIKFFDYSEYFKLNGGEIPCVLNLPIDKIDQSDFPKNEYFVNNEIINRFFIKLLEYKGYTHFYI